MAGIEARIEIWKERLKSGSEDIRDGAALSMLMHLNSSHWRKTLHSGEFSLEMAEGYGQIKAMLFDAVDKGTVTTQPIVDWVNERKQEEAEIKRVFDAVLKKPLKNSPKPGYER